MDIRLPLGLLFAVFGALLAGFGAATWSSRMYADHSVGVNVNLWSGLAMLIFGAALLWLARSRASATETSSTET